MPRFIILCLATLAWVCSLAGCATRPHATQALTVQMDCGRLPVTVTYADEHATVLAGETKLALKAVRSASGAKYQLPDNEQTFFWSKGNGAYLQIAGRPWPDCIERGSLPDRLQARGNEPFWMTDVHGGQLTLRTPGHPDPTPVTGHRQALANGGIRINAQADGVEVVLDIYQQLCKDSMTGMPYPYRAELAHGQTRAQGCAGAPENLLQGAAWRVIAIDDELVAEDAIGTIEFFADGLVAGQAFCNRFSGRHTLSGEGLCIGPLASTRMACSEALMALENRLIQHLEQVIRFDIGTDGELVLITADNRRISARLKLDQQALHAQ